MIFIFDSKKNISTCYCHIFSHISKLFAFSFNYFSNFSFVRGEIRLSKRRFHMGMIGFGWERERRRWTLTIRLSISIIWCGLLFSGRWLRKWFTTNICSRYTSSITLIKWVSFLFLSIIVSFPITHVLYFSVFSRVTISLDVVVVLLLFNQISILYTFLSLLHLLPPLTIIYNSFLMLLLLFFWRLLSLKTFWHVKMVSILENMPEKCRVKPKQRRRKGANIFMWAANRPERCEWVLPAARSRWRRWEVMIVACAMMTSLRTLVDSVQTSILSSGLKGYTGQQPGSTFPGQWGAMLSFKHFYSFFPLNDFHKSIYRESY